MEACTWNYRCKTKDFESNRDSIKSFRPSLKARPFSRYEVVTPNSSFCSDASDVMMADSPEASSQLASTSSSTSFLQYLPIYQKSVEPPQYPSAYLFWISLWQLHQDRDDITSDFQPLRSADKSFQIFFDQHIATILGIETSAYWNSWQDFLRSEECRRSRRIAIELGYLKAISDLKKLESAMRLRELEHIPFKLIRFPTYSEAKVYQKKITYEGSPFRFA